MSQPTKISFRKVLRAFTTLLVLVACVLAVMGARQFNASLHLKGVTFDIINEDAVQFHNQATLKKLLLENTHLNWRKLTIQELNLNRLEKIAQSDPWINSANAYVDNKNILHIQVRQREPKVRLYDVDGNSFYIDSALTTIPISSNYVAYVPIVTSLPSYKNDSVSKSIRAHAYAMASAIANDRFWNAQVAEIIWSRGNDFTLVPNIGQHRIRIGDTSNLTTKLASVFKFYQQVMNKIGWNRYTLIDARFNNQIVASPALPWKPPVDKAMTTMNWVKSVMGNDSSDGVFKGMLMDEPPTSIAEQVEFVPNLPLSAMNGDWNLATTVVKDSARTNGSIVSDKPLAPQTVDAVDLKKSSYESHSSTPKKPEHNRPEEKRTKPAVAKKALQPKQDISNKETEKSPKIKAPAEEVKQPKKEVLKQEIKEDHKKENQEKPDPKYIFEG